MTTPFKHTDPPLPPRPAPPPTYEHPDVQRQRKWDVFNALLVLRVANACLVSTFFQPDEYFQALEPAWALVFGDAGRETGAWLTWEWTHGLRSALHPALIAVLYRAGLLVSALLNFPQPVRAQLLVLLPGVAQGVATALGEYATWRLAERVYGRNSREAMAVVLASAASPWIFFTGTRTLSNTLEAALTAVALALWPWSLLGGAAEQPDLSTLRYSVVLAAVAVVLRPTNVLIWAPLALWTLVKSPRRHAAAFLQDGFVYGSGVIAVTLALDSQYYAGWSIPALRWLQYNLQQNLAVFYGVNRVDYYFTEGLPMLLTTALPFALVGLAKATIWIASPPPADAEPGNKPIRDAPATHPHPPPAQPPSVILRPLALAVLVTVGALTAISHKEARFLAPLLSPLLLLAAPSLTTLASRKILLSALVVLNVALALYASRFHQAGPLTLITHLRRTHEAKNLEYYTRQPGAVLHETTVAFLMPCHSTPWRSHLYYPEIRAWALTCEPPIDVPAALRASYMDEADVFYADPVSWLDAHLAARGMPGQVAFFESLVDQDGGSVAAWLAAHGYAECWRGFGSHVHDDWRRRGSVLVWCRE